MVAELLLLELGRRQGPDEAPHPLGLALGLEERVEDQPVGEHDGDDEHRDDPPDRLIAEAEEVGDGPDEVWRDGDRQEADADKKERHDDRPVRIPSCECDNDQHDDDRDEHADEPQDAGHADL